MIRLLKRVRSAIFTWHLYRIAAHAGRGVKANGYVRAKNIIIGDNCHFNGMKIYGSGQVTIGNNFHSGKGLMVMTEIHNYQGVSLPYDKTVIVKDVEIGDNVWIGVDVCILGGVKIGEGAIIQACSVVAINVPALAIVGGHPAVPFKFRDKDHYYKLKANKCFL